MEYGKPAYIFNPPILDRSRLEKSVIRNYLLSRLSSKTFVISFVLVTALAVMDLFVLNWASVHNMELVPYGSAITYSTVICLYGACIVEAFGISILVKAGTATLTRCRSLI